MLFKRLTLLICIMALSLSLLTACSTGGNKKDDKSEKASTEELSEKEKELFKDEDIFDSKPEDAIILSKKDMDENLYNGVWYTTNGGIDAYLPSEWPVADLTDAEKEKDIVFKAGAADSNASFTVTAVPLNKPDDYDSERLYYEIVNSYSYVSYAEANGIEGVLYDDRENSVCGFVAMINGQKVTVTVTDPSPEQYQEFQPTLWNIFNSICLSGM